MDIIFLIFVFIQMCVFIEIAYSSFYKEQNMSREKRWLWNILHYDKENSSKESFGKMFKKTYLKW